MALTHTELMRRVRLLSDHDKTMHAIYVEAGNRGRAFLSCDLYRVREDVRILMGFADRDDRRATPELGNFGAPVEKLLQDSLRKIFDEKPRDGDEALRARLAALLDDYRNGNVYRIEPVSRYRLG